jgi:hypothetical protein
MNKSTYFATILVFGSIWGVAECVIGGPLRDINLPAGAILTGIFALTLLSLNRIIFNQPGMQIGMGLVAGTLRLINPIGGCFICSAIAIMAEGIIFEIIWTHFSLDIKKLTPLPMSISVGIITANLLYIGGFIITQILTPFFSTAGFYASNLITYIPQIFAGGLLASLLGAAILPITIKIPQLHLHLSERLYIPTTMGISIICWIIVIANTLLLIS